MEITKNVILDLMPLYLADEVSADTKKLVDDFLKNDPELKKVFDSEKIDLPQNVTVPIKKEDKLEAYMKVKQLQIVKTIVFGVLISGVFLAILAAVMILTTH